MTDFGLIITIVLTGMGIIIGMGAIVITLFLWNRGEANADRRDIVDLIIAIKEDVKDFHSRLERQDLEFRQKLLVIEERRGKS